MAGFYIDAVGCCCHAQGKLVLLVHQVRRLIGRHERRFRQDELINVREDLYEMIGDRGIVSVAQQLNIVQRILRSYEFLQLRQRVLLQ
jgi:hypothetical protein